ncbi:MAG: 16S rRNA (cytidine(1402)-2'-O)-methyltransferase [Clostridiales bacterium]|jgi:16S rRNA (cytidine1402-2'-O)-methyltransferase|nr:16S rRNA (cytidine(1402)-2'-O)-methyltransferase [Clostridiales bacterium]
MTGTLYIVGTPIGNLEDISLRALRALKECDCIAAEDTRHTIKLLNYYEIKTPLTAYHEHNKRVKGEDLLRQLKEGRNIALVSDAGMPGISDPGKELINLCYTCNITVTVVPGPTAVISGLVLSGMDSRRFVFEGFLPRDKKTRSDRLTEISNETRTVVIYEAPHHIIETVGDLRKIDGHRQSALVREITKKFEEVILGDLDSLAIKLNASPPVGEMVLILEGVKPIEPQKEFPPDIKEHVDMYTQKGYELKDAMKSAARDRGVSKREIYKMLLTGFGENGE